MVNVLALPSKGRINFELMRRLSELGLEYANPNYRCYQNELKGYPNIIVKLMPASVIAKMLMCGGVDFGLTGLDLISESAAANLHINTNVAMHHKYAIARASVSVLVPKHWVDFNCLADLRMLSLLKNIRVATKYINLTRRFFDINQLKFLEVFRSNNVIELEPLEGSSDFVVDIVSTGNTVRSNFLKHLDGGTILNSSACLFYRTDRKFCNEALNLIQMLSNLPML
ncbi:MAG: ATP phosphoribosyltransferase [Candidatus Hodgkinia cicadicola]